MLNLLAAENIKLFRSKKIWISLSILFLLPILQVANSMINVKYGNELVQAKDIVVNGATGILMIDKNGFYSSSALLLVFLLAKNFNMARYGIRCP
ncbi:hypothetical protein [Sporosarcina sp. USHLN248]|uniref:hypothetical protein n=1 Tax=Sporosarcina sp. USHLN248 TaxID=3081300 RepID=UPI003018C2B1